LTQWKAKRFWKNATVQDASDGFTVTLDGRPVKTPGKRPLVVPTKGLALEIAAEWQAQDEQIRPETMPFTRSANAAIDKVVDQFDEVVELLAAYGDSDLLCYRATDPEALVTRQSQAWDPLLDWAATTLDAHLDVRSGVMHAPQDGTSLARLTARVEAMDAFELTGFHDLVGLSGSLILALAVTKKRLTPDEAWTLSRVDEDWQAEQWGEDEEACLQNNLKMNEFLHAGRFFDMSQTR